MIFLSTLSKPFAFYITLNFNQLKKKSVTLYKHKCKHPYKEARLFYSLAGKLCYN